jgi:predicted transcriptional regulator
VRLPTGSAGVSPPHSTIRVEYRAEETAMATTVKEHMLEIIREQPDDSSYDEILRELAFARMVERGLADSDAGRTISSEEMEKRISSWVG